jgi:hypothetical protein
MDNRGVFLFEHPPGLPQLTKTIPLRTVLPDFNRDRLDDLTPIRGMLWVPS